MRTVMVREVPGGGLAQTVTAGHHALTADEPAEAGGGDLGPTPYDLLLAALGACTAMTLRLYARRKGWPLAAVAVSLTHDRRHAEDCAACDTRPVRIEVVTRAIALQGDLDDAQRRRLLEIAERCPVHRTLTAGLRVDTRLV